MTKVSRFFAENANLIGRWTASLAAAAGGAVVFYALFKKFDSETNDWLALAKVSFALVIAFGFTAVIRYSFGSVARSESRIGNDNDPRVAMRTRIAPLVIILGSAVIATLAAGIIVAFSLLAFKDPTLLEKVDTQISGVFSAVLPVFATWVGTVIAFYFTNESYRQAAEATRSALEGPREPKQPVAEKMIPFDKITKIEVERPGVRTVRMSQVIEKFSESVTRIIIFDMKKQPVFVIRKKRTKQEWLDDASLPDSVTVNEYLSLTVDGLSNADDATNFGYVAEADSIEKARTAISASRSSDLFVTASGQKTEPVIGWLTDDLLKS